MATDPLAALTEALHYELDPLGGMTEVDDLAAAILAHPAMADLARKEYERGVEDGIAILRGTADTREQEYAEVVDALNAMRVRHADLARLAAIGEAVERLPDTAYTLLVEYDSTVESSGQECQVSLSWWVNENHDSALRTHGATAQEAFAAIAAALEQDG